MYLNIFVSIMILLGIISAIKYYISTQSEKNIQKLKKKNSLNNIKFINERINYIIKFFNDDSLAELLVNYKNNEIVGFFIIVREEQYGYISSEINKKRLPSISHEMDIDEFCNFLAAYTNPSRNDYQVLEALLRIHLSRLSHD